MTKARLLTLASVPYLALVGGLAAFVHSPLSPANQATLGSELPQIDVAQRASERTASETQRANSARHFNSSLGKMEPRQNLSIPARIPDGNPRANKTIGANPSSAAAIQQAVPSREPGSVASQAEVHTDAAAPMAPIGQPFPPQAVFARQLLPPKIRSPKISAPTGNAFRYQGGVATVQESGQELDASGSAPEVIIAVGPDEQQSDPSATTFAPEKHSRRSPLIPIEEEVFRAKWGQAAYDAARNGAAAEGRRKFENSR